MKTKSENLMSQNTTYGARYVERFPINLPAEQIDLYQWIAEMSEPDYTSYSPAHRAMNSYFKDEKLYMTNVENIGTDQLIQHYELKYHATDHVQLYSAKTEAYIMRWFHVTVGVPWEMQIRPLSYNSCELVCLVGADYYNPILKAAAWLNGLGGTFIKKHLKKEGKAFAKNIEEKFKSG